MPIPSEPGHPLFLPEDEDDDPVNVSEIQIIRIENGQQVYYPRVFPAAELQSLEQVAAELGGGSYILVARHDHRITTRKKYVIPGKPKPMYDEGRQEKPQETANQPAVDPMLAMMGGSQGGVMGLIMMMMQQMMQQQSQSSQQQTQLLIAMMQSNRDSSAEDKAAARAELQANIERERIASERNMTLMRELLQARSGNGDSGESFYKGVEFMRSFAAQQIEMVKGQLKGEDTDYGSILETIGQVMQGLQMFNAVKGSGLPEGVTPEVPAT